VATASLVSSTSSLPELSLRCCGPSTLCGAVSSAGTFRRRSGSYARHIGPEGRVPADRRYRAPPKERDREQ